MVPAWREPNAARAGSSPPRSVFSRTAVSARDRSPFVPNPAAAWREIAERARATRDYLVVQELVRRARDLERSVGLPAAFVRARISVLSGAASQFLEGPLWLALITAGLAPDIALAPYGSIAAQMLDPESPTTRFAPELACVIHTWRDVPEWPGPDVDARRADAVARRVCASILEPCRLLHERCGTQFVIDTFAPPPFRPGGNLAAKRPGDPANFVRRLNLLLGDRAPDYVHLHDVTGLIEQHGLRAWVDLPFWYHAKLPVSFACLPEYAHSLASVAGACFGRSRKCIVLDLDNTLWGGVVADDGVGGIQIGEGSAVGEAHKAFQQHLARIAERGVLLAVCSKNDERIARLPFEQHPEMVLRLDDIACFAAGWGAKSDALRRIARELNLGLDALVFVDDDPAQREEVRQALPEVAVPELGRDPAEYARVLDDGRWFESVSVTAEDRSRTQAYRQRRAVEDLRVKVSDPESFLESLAMRAVVRPFEPIAFQRIRQLANKTNQFNLTTRRLGPGEVEALSADPSWITQTVRLADRFGDQGLVSVLFARVAGDVAEIEGWLMSCRVVQRGVEQLAANELVRAARALGVRELRGRYVQSERNGLVADHYAKLGFRPSGRAGDATLWSLSLSDFAPLATHIELAETS